jgi:hypothetical protein
VQKSRVQTTFRTCFRSNTQFGLQFLHAITNLFCTIISQTVFQMSHVAIQILKFFLHRKIRQIAKWFPTQKEEIHFLSDFYKSSTVIIGISKLSFFVVYLFEKMMMNIRLVDNSLDPCFLYEIDPALDVFVDF